MPTLAPQSETPNEMINRQVLDVLARQADQLRLVPPNAPLTYSKRADVLLSVGQWSPQTAPQGVVRTITGQGPGSSFAALVVPANATLQAVHNMAFGTVTIAPTANLAFVGCRFEGVVTVQAGAQVAFTGCDFAGPNSFVDNAGLAADVTITGGIHRNAVPHVNTTTVNELVV